MGGTPSKSSKNGQKAYKDAKGASGIGNDFCPHKFKAVITGPAAGLTPGTWLDLVLDETNTPSRVVFINPATSSIVGALAAIPDLDVFIQCLKSIEYRAYVESVAGGRVDVTVIRQ